jgi:Spy/CpxP family protein refolding chaperone
MKKFSLTNSLLALVIALLSADTAWAQRETRANRPADSDGLIGQRRLESQIRRPQGRRPRRPSILNPQLRGRGKARQPNKMEQRQRLMEAIGLNNQQRLRMEDIRRNHEDEAITIGRRIRQARNALDRAIMDPDYDEALIRRRAEDLAAARADQIRFQARVRAAFRSVLTPDQVTRLRELEREANRLNRERKLREQREQNLLQEEPADPRPPTESEQSDAISLLLFPRLSRD